MRQQHLHKSSHPGAEHHGSKPPSRTLQFKTARAGSVSPDGFVQIACGLYGSSAATPEPSSSTAILCALCAWPACVAHSTPLQAPSLICPRDMGPSPAATQLGEQPDTPSNNGSCPRSCPLRISQLLHCRAALLYQFGQLTFSADKAVHADQLLPAMSSPAREGCMRLIVCLSAITCRWLVCS